MTSEKGTEKKSFEGNEERPWTRTPARPGELHGRTGASTTTAFVEAFFGGSTSPVSLRHLSDPIPLGLAPGPVTGDFMIEPDLTLTTTGVTKIIPLSIRLWRPDDRVQTN